MKRNPNLSDLKLAATFLRIFFCMQSRMEHCVFEAIFSPCTDTPEVEEIIKSTEFFVQTCSHLRDLLGMTANCKKPKDNEWATLLAATMALGKEANAYAENTRAVCRETSKTFSTLLKLFQARKTLPTLPKHPKHQAIGARTGVRIIGARTSTTRRPLQRA